MIFRFSSARLVFGLFTLALIVLACPAHPAQAGFRIKKIVDNYTPIPNGGGATFSPRGAPGTSGDWVIFDTGDLTIWRSTPSGKRLKKLITQNTPIPGGWGNFHQFFANYAQISGDTLVLVADACGGCGSGVGIFTRSVEMRVAASRTPNSVVNRMATPMMRNKYLATMPIVGWSCCTSAQTNEIPSL